jgi:hypothetical protein
MFQGFVHPLLLWGLLAAAVPLIIHLLNRRRHRPLEWAAMRFVLAAYRRTRRRVQLENLLLLLLRMAAVAALAMAIARPFIGKDSPLAPLTERRRDVVLLLDSSASTGYRESTTSVHEAILERARDLLGDMDGTRGDRVRLFDAAGSLVELSSHTPEDALAALTTVASPRDEALDLGALLARVVELAEEDAGESGSSALEARLLTDLQRGTFLPNPGVDAAEEGAGSRTAVEQALDRLAELGVTVLVEDLGPDAPQPPNLGIELIEPAQELVGAGQISDVRVRVRNHGSAGRSGVRVALSVDGVRQPSRTVEVEARGVVDVLFGVVFSEPGFHALTAELEGDRLAADDQRSEVVFVPRPLDVLLVDGDPSEDLDRDEVGYLRAALEPLDDGGPALALAGAPAPFRCRSVAPALLGSPEADPSDHDVVFLANVANVPAEVAGRLTRWVADGGALFFTLGDRSADASALQSLTARLWHADGSGLLPARPLHQVTLPSRREQFFRAASFDESHPALHFFTDDRFRPFLTEIPVYSFVAVEPLADARVLVRLDDADRSPLLLERDFDLGRVYLWTTSIDDDWNLFPQSPATLIPLFHELVRRAGTGQVPQRNAAVGSALEVEVESFPRQAVVVRPDGTRRPIDGEPLEVREGRWRLPPFGTLDHAGLWRIEAESMAPVALACRMDPTEGDLEHLLPQELENAHRAWRIFQPGSAAAESDEPELDRGETWRWFAAAALLMLVLETLWAAWIGRERRLV